jgi:hypothetical protein
METITGEKESIAAITDLEIERVVAVVEVVAPRPYNFTDNKPSLKFIENNGGGLDILLDNFIYQHHKRGKFVTNYTCREPGCGGSLSVRLAAEKPNLNEPSHMHFVHNHDVNIEN